MARIHWVLIDKPSRFWYNEFKYQSRCMREKETNPYNTPKTGRFNTLKELKTGRKTETGAKPETQQKLLWYYFFIRKP